jgi:hypothetical protein
MAVKIISIIVALFFMADYLLYRSSSIRGQLQQLGYDVPLSEKEAKKKAIFVFVIAVIINLIF